jgi:hypothetical protein
VTDAYANRPRRTLDREWTEVILLGRDAAHNTVAELVPGLTAKNWLMRLINTRFYRLPAGVTVRSANLTTGQQANRNAAGLEDLTLKHAERGRQGRSAGARRPRPPVRVCRPRGRSGSEIYRPR